jgi:NADH-quinone oxidoreductase subunit G
MDALGSPNIDCRQDGAALDPAHGRASPTLQFHHRGHRGQADAILIVGANPRFEAPVLNARIRKAGAPALKIG